MSPNAIVGSIYCSNKKIKKKLLTQVSTTSSLNVLYNIQNVFFGNFYWIKANQNGGNSTMAAM